MGIEFQGEEKEEKEEKLTIDDILAYALVEEYMPEKVAYVVVQGLNKNNMGEVLNHMTRKELYDMFCAIYVKKNKEIHKSEEQFNPNYKHAFGKYSEALYTLLRKKAEM